MNINQACAALHKDNVEAVDLSGKKLGKKEVLQLAGALANNKTLLRLNLSRTGIGVSALKALEASLATHPKITKLELAYNMIDHKGAHVVVEILKKNRSIKELDLEKNKLGRESLITFCEVGRQLRLKSLNLGFNPFSAHKGLLPLFCRELLPSKTLVHLNFRGFNQKNVESSDVGDQLNFSKVIAGCQQLKSLDLSSNHIEFQGLALIAVELSKNTTLKTLSLSDNPLLSNVMYVKKTDQDGNSYYVWKHYGDVGGFQKLGLALQKSENSALSTLYLNRITHNPITDFVESDIRRMLKSSSLGKLEIIGERMTPFAHYRIQLALQVRKKPVALAISSKFGVLPAIDGSTTNHSAANNAVRQLKKNTIQTLDLSHSNLAPQDFAPLGAALKTNASLTELNVSGNNLSKNNFSGLRDLALGVLQHPALRVLILRDTKLDNGAASLVATLLSYNTSVTTLDLSRNNIKKDGFKEILCRLPYREVGPVIPFGGHQMMMRMFFDLEQATPEVLGPGKELYDTKDYPDVIDSFIPVCDDQMLSLQRLDLSHNPILINEFGRWGRPLIEHILGNNTTLHMLDLSNPVKRGILKNKILKEKHILPLSAALQKNNSLTSLNLTGYKIKGPGMEGIHKKLAANQKVVEKKRRAKKLDNKPQPTSTGQPKKKSTKTQKQPVAKKAEPVKKTKKQESSESQ